MIKQIVKKENGRSMNMLLALLTASFCLVLAFFFAVWRFDFADEVYGNVPSALTCFVGVACAACACYFYVKGKLDNKKIIALIIVCGFALRLAYVLRNKYFVNQHDVESLSSDGHLLYIFGIANGDGLPKTNNWQFCHPPLHHMLSALVVKISWAFGLNNGDAFENIQLLTCLYSALTLVGGVKLLQLCGVKDKSLVFSTALLSFHPTFFILAGSINNDALSILMMLYALIFLIKWCKNSNLINALLTGLFAGLGMMTKFSAALMVAITAVTVIVKFIKDKNLKFTKVLLHTGCYLAVVLPLGMWFAVRNNILFDQPLGYVAPLGIDNPLYTGDISLVKRALLPFSLDSVGVYTDVWNEYNLWTYLLRNSLFGEYKFGNTGVAAVLVTLNALVVLLSIAAFACVLVKRFRDTDSVLPVALMLVLQMAVFVYFNIKYPFGCSMDFRYIVPTLFSTAVFIGMSDNMLCEVDGTLKKNLSYILRFTVAVFCAISVLVFI